MALKFCFIFQIVGTFACKIFLLFYDVDQDHRPQPRRATAGKKKKIWNCCVYIALWRHMFIFIILLLAAGLSNDQIQFLCTL